jgi:hypothetical protein
MRSVLLCCLPLALLVAGCHSVDNHPAAANAPAPAKISPEQSRVWINGTFALTPAQIKTLSAMAQAGNTDAAEKLALHYVMVVCDTPKGIYWLRIGAQHGSARCRHNLEELEREDAQYRHKG